MQHFLLLSLAGLLSLPLVAQLNNPHGVPYRWKTDTSQRIVDLSELTVALPRGSFPTLDHPALLDRAEGEAAFLPLEPAISVVVGDRARAYPLSMLTVHEISNDTLGGVPILVSYCPLCNASMVYLRTVRVAEEERVLSFAVSGMLRNSDMVMSDRTTESWWQQLTGEGLVGEMAGMELRIVPSQVLTVRDFFRAYPDGEIISPRGGAGGTYGLNPYVGYDSGETPLPAFFDVTAVDERLPAFERVVDVAGPEGHRIYPFTAVAKHGVLNDRYGGRDLVLFYRPGALSVLDRARVADSRPTGVVAVFNAAVDGRVLTFRRDGDHFLDRETGSRWDITGHCRAGTYAGTRLEPVGHGNHFAFAWLAFYPDSEIYGLR